MNINELKKYIFNSVNKMLASMVMCFLLVAMASGLTKSDFGLIILQIMQMLVFLGLPYLNLKKIGQQDQNFVLNGDRPEDLFKGFKTGLACFIILEVSVILLVLMKLGILPDAIYIYKVLNPQFVGLAWFIAPDSAVAAVSWYKILCFALLPFLYPLIMEVGYLVGYKDTSWV